MREIKFRGKRVDNGEWVHGYIVKVASPCGLGWVMHIPAKDPDDNHRVVQVNPSTVGQYTGLKDKNGVEIYEGDVVSSYDKRFKAVVEFESGIFQPFNDNDMCIFYADECEILGNIHDNPELLGGAE